MDAGRAFGGDAAALASSIYDRCTATLQLNTIKKHKAAGCDALVRQILELSETFNRSPTQQLAFHTIISQVKRHRLMWHSKTGSVLPDVDVPQWWHTFISDAVRAIVITGCCFYRIYTRGEVTTAVVAHPCHVLPRWNAQSKRWEASERGWHCLLFEAPLKGPWQTQTIAVLRSSCIRAYEATLRLESLQHNWTKRDGLNSNPTVYTTVSSELTQQNGSKRQWFRNVDTATLQTHGTNIDSSFASLVHKRADTIRQLDAATTVRRERQNQSKHARDSPGELPCDPEPVEHTEHIISDGNTYTEARALSSLPDTKTILDDLTHQIFFAFGVPPQALGKNINSERLASSNRLVEIALTGFILQIEDLRRQLQTALRTATETPKGAYLGFALVLEQHELNSLLPVLTTRAARDMISRTFRVPASFIDPERVARQQDMARDTPAKRPRTEEESVAVLRHKASKPHTP